MSLLNNKKTMNESELRSLIKVLLEDKSLGQQLVKVNPVVDPSALLTDPSNPDYKPNTKQELQVALTTIINNMPDDKVPDMYDLLRGALHSQEQEDKGKDQMDKSNKKVEESIRMTIRALLEKVEFPRSIKEYYAKDSATGEMVWKGSGPAPKLASGSTSVQKLDPSARGTVVGPQSPAGKALKKTFKKMKYSDLTMSDTSEPDEGRMRRNKMQEGDKLLELAREFGFKNPNGVLQFINRILEKLKRRFADYDAVVVASLEIMKEYIDELSSPYKSGSKMLDPLITPQDAEVMRQHPELIKDLETFRVYLNKKLRERGL